jgi:hypothetical protein
MSASAEEKRRWTYSPSMASYCNEAKSSSADCGLQLSTFSVSVEKVMAIMKSAINGNVVSIYRPTMNGYHL